ncbi:MAG: murein biosynthesis integral membrane protein MurJ [Alphaproteobacteria bacterium]|jgi:putative peptidoglycan lipid II flippase|nr:murein biosynthesis integral membrane protein MurJ [Alphaproteobacteria bacterium]
MALVRFAATVGGYTMASRILGFVRDILIAAVVGTGPVADAFFVAFKLPNFFRRLFAEGAFNAGFVPLFSKILEVEGRAAAKLFAERALSLLLVILLVFVTGFQIAMPWAMHGLAPGFVDEPWKFDLTVTLTRLTFPYLLLISLVSLLAGVLNSMRRFAAAASAPIILNLCLIAGLTLFADVGRTPGHALAWAVSIAGICQFLWLMLACRRAGMGLRLRRPRLSPRVAKLMRLILPAAIGAGVVQVNMVIDIILASLLPSGSVSFLFYADRLNQLPIGVVGVAIGTALLPLISRHLAAGEEGAANAVLNRALEVALILTLPAAAAFLVIPDEVIAVLFERGAFDAHSTAMTAAALAAYATGLPAYVLVKILGPAFFGRLDIKTPVVVGGIAVVANLILNLILMWFFLHVGLAMATAISAWLNVALLALILRRRSQFEPDRRLLEKLAKAVLATVVMVLCLGLAGWALSPLFEGGVALRFGGLAALVVTGLAVYGLAALALGIVSPTQLRTLLARGS